MVLPYTSPGSAEARGTARGQGNISVAALAILLVETCRQCQATFGTNPLPPSLTTPRAPSLNKEGEGLSSTILTLIHPE
ncbi:hypothetical protein SAMN05192553_104371 [Cyclobacterium xiamenense]|uniref:Uncharacterized protein n=1 Tax=Cyclobacterium xiamenense TaxID=1297121 RepID=A0A1H6ZBD8_9BACT|nr:hypothetical protein SAMN05192553_104371 [Cyclobacterium xiamenense]